jgi:hypothetical protein
VKSRGAEAYMALAKEFLARNQHEQPGSTSCLVSSW